jgi:hypothetical protein
MYGANQKNERLRNSIKKLRVVLGDFFQEVVLRKK